MLRVSHLKKTFNEGTVDEKVALNDLLLMLPDGNFAAIVGSSGAGKSTFFNVIAGNFYVDDDEIFLDDLDITLMLEHKRSRIIGRLFQDPLLGTTPHMTVEENLTIAYLRASGHTSAFSRSAARDRIFFREQLSELHMGLEDRMEQPVGLLSGGQRQALTLLMATVVTPKLLLLDEHTAALDPKTVERVLDLTVEIVREWHISCLMVTHNMYQALVFGNRTLIMDGGRIVFDVSGETRAAMAVQDLFDQFKKDTGSEPNDDRILLPERAENSAAPKGSIQWSFLRLQFDFFWESLFPYDTPRFVNIRQRVKILVAVVVKCSLQGHLITALILGQKAELFYEPKLEAMHFLQRHTEKCLKIGCSYFSAVDGSEQPVNHSLSSGKA